jgi:predicted phosphohydrolase
VARNSGIDAAGIDSLIQRSNAWYACQAEQRRLEPGDRVVVIGLGIAVVECADSNHVRAILSKRKVLNIEREGIVWCERYTQWETAEGVNQQCGRRPIRIIVIADTHDLHRQLEVPPGDILIHAGDFSNFARQTSQLQDFNDWLGELPHPFKVVVPGNHELALEDPWARDAIYNAVLLGGEGATIGGLRIWGSPATPPCGAFGISTCEGRKRYWTQVPNGVDILISHGPPFGVLDLAPGSQEHAGDPQLLEAVHRAEPRLHVFGHIHGAYGTMATEHTKFVNAALFGEFGDLDKPPVVVELDPVQQPGQIT